MTREEILRVSDMVEGREIGIEVVAARVTAVTVVSLEVGESAA